MVIYGRSISYDYALDIYEALTNGNTYSEEKFERAVNEILKIAQEYKLSGNCFQNYLAWLIINDENPFSVDCEMKKNENSLKRFAETDISFMRKMFFVTADKSEIPENVKQLFGFLEDFKIENDGRETNLKVIGKLACDLAHKLADTNTDKEFLDTIAEFYSLCGVGMFGLNKAFRIKEHIDGDFSLIPVSVFEEVLFCDLWGYEDQ